MSLIREARLGFTLKIIGLAIVKIQKIFIKVKNFLIIKYTVLCVEFLFYLYSHNFTYSMFFARCFIFRKIRFLDENIFSGA